MAAPHRHRTPREEAAAIERKVASDGGPGANAPDAGSRNRAERPIELPSDYDQRHRSSSAPPVTYYEGENCSGSAGAAGGYYDGVSVSGDDDDDDDDDDGGTTTTAGDDDDDDDDDDGKSVPIEWGDDDDDDDDDDTTKTSSLKPLAVPKAGTKTAMQTPSRRSSPVSRLALLGVLVAFPLRRRGMLAGHARRRHGSE